MKSKLHVDCTCQQRNKLSLPDFIDFTYENQVEWRHKFIYIKNNPIKKNKFFGFNQYSIHLIQIYDFQLFD